MNDLSWYISSKKPNGSGEEDEQLYFGYFRIKAFVKYDKNGWTYVRENFKDIIDLRNSLKRML